MEKPILSPDFTLEDIRKIRDYNAYLHESMTDEEYVEGIRQKARAVLAEYEEYKKKRLPSEKVA
jgi:hypothetical protein